MASGIPFPLQQEICSPEAPPNVGFHETGIHEGAGRFKRAGPRSRIASQKAVVAGVAIRAHRLGGKERAKAMVKILSLGDAFQVLELW